MKFLKLGLFVLLATALTASSWAEDVYVKNKPFKGHASGSGSATMVEAKAMLKALGISDFQIEGGQLVMGEQSVPVQSGPKGPMVSLQALTEALGAKMVLNSGLGTIDVYQGAEKSVASRHQPVIKKTGEAPSHSPPVVKAKQDTPGDKVAVEDYMVFGKTNIVYFYADW